MSTTIDQYREAKNSYLKLRTQAKKELLARFHALGNELLQLQRELLEDFGEKVAIPSKPKKGKPSAGAKMPAVPAAAAPAPPSPKTAALQKQLEKQKKKLAEQQAASKPTKAIEDRIYEIEDEIRLSQSED